MPCVHLAATCYALARSFEEDPFGVFAWRGRGRDELLLHLRELRSVPVSSDAVSLAAGSGDSGASASSSPAEDLGDLADFWGSVMPSRGRPVVVARSDALLDQLDPPPLAHDGRPIVDLLRPAYGALSQE